MKQSKMSLVIRGAIIVVVIVLLVITANAQIYPPDGWNEPEYNEYYFGATSIRTMDGKIGISDLTDNEFYDLQFGDWIGFFCYDLDSSLKCCGANQYLDSTQNLGISLVGDISWTPDKEGFYEGEEMLQQVYSFSLQRSLLVDSITFSDPSEDSTILNDFYCWENYFYNTKLYVVDTIFPCVNLQKHHVFLETGWNGLSSYITPIDRRVDVMFAGLVNDEMVATPLISDREPNISDFTNTRELVILKDMYQMYFPEQGINTMGMWQPDKGYIIKLTDTATLTFLGLPVENTAIDYSSGWHLIPVLVDGCYDTYDNFGDMTGGATDLLKAIRHPVGGVYWYSQGIFALDVLEAGNAYKMHVDAPFTIDYSLQVDNINDIEYPVNDGVIDGVIADVVVYDLVGRVIYTGDVKDFHTGHYDAGIYVIKYGENVDLFYKD